MSDTPAQPPLDEPVAEPADPRFGALVPADVAVERISTDHLFTEGPVWDARHGRLLWSDIAGDTIWSWTPESGRAAFRRPSGKTNGLTLDHEGRLIAAGWTSRSVWRLEADGSVTTLVTHLDGQRVGTPNDIVVRSDGVIFWSDGTSGTRHAGFETRTDLQIQRKSSVVGSWDPRTDRAAIATAESGTPNGLALSPDEEWLYVNDSAARVLRAFRVTDDARLIDGRVLAERTGSATKVDRDGNIWTTGSGGIHIMASDGTFLGRVRVPEKGSNLAWGEADWGTLFVTSGRSVYRLRTSATGIPVG